MNVEENEQPFQLLPIYGAAKKLETMLWKLDTLKLNLT